MKSSGCFWAKIATGITSEKAVDAVGVSTLVGTRWFRHRGGMSLFMSNQISGRYLSFAEREEIGLLQAQSFSVREIARRLGRSPSTISRELTRNAATRSGRLEYLASVAQWKTELVAKKPKPVKMVTNSRPRHYVQDRLEGKVHDVSGHEITGPRQAPLKGQNKRMRPGITSCVIKPAATYAETTARFHSPAAPAGALGHPSDRRMGHDHSAALTGSSS